MQQKFTPIEHTADVGIIAYGKTIPELIENASEGMYSFLADLKTIKAEEKEELSAEGIDKESLLINWLNSLLYLTSTKRVIFTEFKIKKTGSFSVSGTAFGGKIDASKHPPDTEIKAATYSDLKIIKTAKGYSARIIFDV